MADDFRYQRAARNYHLLGATSEVCALDPLN
jgi:hypothetical protein